LDDSAHSPDRGRPVRVEDVAKVAGVSPITVSRALRTPEKVKPATLERVLEAVKETGYHVNSIASSLRSGQSSFISVFVASLQNPHYAAAMQGVIDAFEGSRFHLMFAQTGYAEDLSAETVRSMLPFKPAAILFTGIVRNEETRDFLRSLQVPIMELWGEEPNPIDMVVTSPGSQGGRLMGEHFGEQGFKRIAYIGHTHPRSTPRIDGFAEGLRKFGSKISLLLPNEGTSEMEDGARALERILEELPDCDAMLFGTDVMAAGALVRARELDIAVPGQIAIAGYGDLYFTAHTRPTMTSVRIFDYEIGQSAGNMLLERLRGGIVEQPIIQVPLKLEVRGSTTRQKT
jgi:LacI family transcriptional regulator, gluconate utilization system Gnt-I transcriptional repressor